MGVAACSDDLRSREPPLVHLGALQWYLLIVSTRATRTSSSMESGVSWDGRGGEVWRKRWHEGRERGREVGREGGREGGRGGKERGRKKGKARRKRGW